MDSYIGRKLRGAIRNFKGLKVAFIQDEYRWINRSIHAFRDLGIQILFGVVPQEIVDQVYPPHWLPGVLRETVLTGYVPLQLLTRDVPKFENRTIDVGYRARKVPAWLGSFGQEKWLISARFMKDAVAYGLTCDMSTTEEDRIYGESWIEFLSNCKAVLGTESGASICDFTGEIQRRVETHVALYPEASFETLRDLYFKEEDGRIVLSVISPRCFEAAALRSLMILYEGHYSGRLQPWQHYVPLKKDHSNMAEVVAVLRDQERAQRIIDTAYREVALNPDNSFAAMVQQVDRAINRTFRADMAKTRPAYSERVFAGVLKRQRLALLKSRLIVQAKVAARRAIIGLIFVVAPSPFRRWGKRRLAAWPGVRRALEFGELDVEK
jgi:hypothetical protein